MAKGETYNFFQSLYVLWAQCWLKENKLLWDLDFQFVGSHMCRLLYLNVYMG